MKNDIDMMQPFLQEAWKNSGFTELTVIQEKTSYLVREGRDIIAEAPTGSGKTLAYLIPILQKIDTSQKQVQAVILASSHELVMQIHQEIQKWTKGSSISSAALIGGANINRQIEKLKKKPQIVAGTPGRILELINRKKLKMHEVQSLVLDEADQLIVDEHVNTVNSIMKSTSKDRQLLLFSATLPQSVEEVGLAYMKDPAVIRVKESETNKPKVNHVYVMCEAREKLDLLKKLTNIPNSKVLAFMRDIGNLAVLAEKLAYKGLDVGVLHSDTRKEQRQKALKTFRTADNALLLATDVAARGLDIDDLTHVVNVDLPKDITQYKHRAGRTGRLGSSGGTIVSLIEPYEYKQLSKFVKEVGEELHEKVLYAGKLINPK
ncbi:RNA helicase [Virgibacillus phasianinus]|uniref:RNA helicase n=1 Tax=Virgibacillus phasianinus TaxID=2017483 RepID=A0A220U7L4_9BACI|nr:DEAD/DEAH box helicase [Virgibacillus phasianinus]ASK63733.1 RNA helicase [Virgibacillus phasianinus]